MNTALVIVLLLFCLVAFVATAVLLDLPVPGLKALRGDGRANMRAIVTAQRTARENPTSTRRRETAMDSAKESNVTKVSSSKLTLRKKLKFGQWTMSPLVFRALEVSISLVAAAVLSLYVNLVLVGFALLSGPLFMRWLLNLWVERRFKAFDADYPAFLLSLVGLLKTGMNVMGALEAAADGLEESSLVRTEVIMMIERLRFGVSEDRSIGSFGEDIYHPEIELFVQALLLSRRVGGTLSDTLERLAKQVRKRQYFRMSASAAVGMQRGSIWFIISILVALEIYLYFMYPQAITGAIKDEMGWQVWQFGIGAILLGIFWVRQVTKIRT